MGKLLTAVFIFAIATPLATSGPSWARNKNNTSTDSNGCHQPGQNNCLSYCDANNKYLSSQVICWANCHKYWCNPANPNPSTAKGGQAPPPIQAPPPKGGTPPKKGGNAAPIIKGNPVQASPGGTSTDHPILERNGSGKH
jgi:hypothetical protein